MNEKIAAGCVTLILVTPVSVFFGGWVLSVLWGWFLVPFGAPAVSWAQAAGIHVVATYLTFHYRARAEPTTDGADLWAPVLYMVSKPPLALFFGWAIKELFL